MSEVNCSCVVIPDGHGKPQRWWQIVDQRVTIRMADGSHRCGYPVTIEDVPSDAAGLIDSYLVLEGDAGLSGVKIEDISTVDVDRIKSCVEDDFAYRFIREASAIGLAPEDSEVSLSLTTDHERIVVSIARTSIRCQRGAS